MDDKSAPPPPDYAALAQRYLELWQDQVAKLAKDPAKEMGDLSAMTAAWSKMAASMGAKPHDSATPWPATAAPAHGDGGVDRASGHGGPDAIIAARLDALERRLGALESRLTDVAEPPAKSPPVQSGAPDRRRGGRKKS